METNEEKKTRSPKKDHSGEVYNDLEILRLNPDVKGGDTYICKCIKCGWEGSLRLDNIKKYGRTSKCNCDKDREIVIGNTYGKLTVLKRDMSVQNVPPTKFRYICKCVDCGWEGSLRHDTVKLGKTSQCNCVKTHNVSYDTTSLIGKPYGDLIVIGFGEYRKGKDSLWKCQCKCGNIIMTTKTNLEKGNTTRCRQCADKIVAQKNHRYGVYAGEVICNNEDPDRSVTVLGFDHYDANERKYYWKWKCNFCGNEGVTSEHGLRNYRFICKKCANIINVKRIQPKFARLTPIKLVDHNGLKWLCKCDCGNETIVNTTDLQYGGVQSCGCIMYQDVKAATPIENYPPNLKGMLQNTYKNMKDRCYNPSCKTYSNYGGKGITICDRWMGEDGCKNFVADMIGTFQPHMTIDRIDSSKGYSPDNCRWITHKDQQNNRENNRSIMYNGKEYQSVQLLLDEFIESDKLSLSDMRSKSSFISGRLSKGWSIEEAIMIPPESYQHPESFHDTTKSYKDDWQKAHPDVDLTKLDKPIKSAIVFNNDRKTDYFEDAAKTNRRNMFYRIIPDPDKQ